MSFNSRPRCHFPCRQHALAMGVAVGMAAFSWPSLAGTLVGGSATVNAGDAPETWQLQSAALTITPGGQADAIQSRDSTLTFDAASVLSTSASPAVDATGTQAQIDGSTFLGAVSFHSSATRRSDALITDSTVTATGSATAMEVNRSDVRLVGVTISSSGSRALSAAQAANVTVIDSTFDGAGLGVSVATGSTLTLDNTHVTSLVSQGANPLAAGHGMFQTNGTANLVNGSSLTGLVNGIYIATFTTAGAPPDVNLLLDNASVTGQTGAAIVMTRDRLVASWTANIEVRNGSTLNGGNGNLLEVSGEQTVNLRVDDSALTGNVLVGATEAANLIFQNNASLTGALANVTSMALADTARWNVTGNSSVGTLDLGSGTLAFAAPSPGYKTVTVAGDLSVNGGTLIFNSPLGDDAAPSDRVAVGGNTSGSGNIVVNNIGGAGGQTVEGIQLISVAGASDAAFALSGRAVGGAYEYFLYKGGVSAPGDGGWYLRSSYSGDPCDLNPSLPVCTPVDPGPGPGDPDPGPGPGDPDPGPGPVDPVNPVDPPPVVRPEPGAYLANQAIATGMFQQRAHDRGERAFDGERAGAWVRVARDQVNGNVLGQIDARGQSNVLQIGSDVARWGTTSSGQIGVMLATGDANTQAVSNLTGYSTRGKVKGDAVGVYGTWVQRANESTGAYVDGWLQYARFDNEVQGEGLAKEKYDATTRAASIEAGYSWAVINRERGAWFIQPQVQVTYTDYKGDTLQEANGTIVQDGRAGGFESRVGVRLFGHDNATGNRVQPFFAMNWLRGDHGNSLLFDGERISATLPTNRYEAQAGAQLKLGLKWSAWGDMRVQRGDGGYREVAGQVGLRRAW